MSNDKQIDAIAALVHATGGRRAGAHVPVEELTCSTDQRLQTRVSGAVGAPLVRRTAPPFILTVAAEAVLQCTRDELAEWAKLPRYEMGTHRPDVAITWDVRDKGIVP